MFSRATQVTVGTVPLRCQVVISKTLMGMGSKLRDSAHRQLPVKIDRDHLAADDVGIGVCLY